MRTPDELGLLRERAAALRREGKSRREIKEILGPMSNSTLDNALRGVPPPGWTRRPNAKDEKRAAARELRAQGLDYEEIAMELGVAKSSVSLWVRDMPVRLRLSYEENRRRSAEGVRRYWATERQVRRTQRAAAYTSLAAGLRFREPDPCRVWGAIPGRLARQDKGFWSPQRRFESFPGSTNWVRLLPIPACVRRQP